jgi:hypothetical protein
VRALSVLLAVIAAVTLAACASGGTDSSSDFEGEEREVASVVEELQTAAADDDASEICRELLAPALIEQLGSQENCQRVVTTVIDATDTTELDVQSVNVSGQNATARVESGTGDNATTRTVQLVRDGRNWKISQL